MSNVFYIGWELNPYVRQFRDARDVYRRTHAPEDRKFLKWSQMQLRYVSQMLVN